MMIDEPQNLVAMARATAARVADAHGIRYYASQARSDYMGFEDLDRRSRAIAVSLAARGLVPGNVVVVAVANGLDFIAATYGALYAGLIIAPAAVSGFGDPRVVAGRIAAMAADSGALLLLSEDPLITTFTAAADDGNAIGIPAVTVQSLIDGGEPDAWVDPGLHSEALAALIYTSGSTGSPKGVMLTHAGMLEFLQIARIAMQADERSVVVGWMPLHHSLGLIMHVLLPAYLGIDAVLTGTEQFQRRPVFWLQLISKHRATISIGSNFAFELCTQFATDEQISELDLSSLTMLMTAGETVRPTTVQEFLGRFAPAGLRESMITPAMGMTEVTYVTVKPIGSQPVVLNADAAELESGTLAEGRGGREIELVSCGRAAPHCTVAIVDPKTGDRLDDGQVGEIWMTSPAVSPGYWRNPVATAATFGARLDGDDRSYVRTGDLGGVVNGDVFLTGRVKDLIIVRGRNIYPPDLEAAAARLHPAIGISAAFELAGHVAEAGIALELDLERLAHGKGEIAELAAVVRSALVKEFSLPSLAVAFLTTGSLPLTAGGKVRRIVTGAMVQRGQLKVLYADGFAARVDQSSSLAEARITLPDGGIAV